MNPSSAHHNLIRSSSRVRHSIDPLTSDSSSTPSQPQSNHQPIDRVHPVSSSTPEHSQSTTNPTNISNHLQSNPSPSSRRPLACGRRRRHTISNNHIEFVFYHCLREDIDEDDEEEHDDEEDEDEDSIYHRISPRRQDPSLLDLHHCDVIVLKTDNGWCFDQDIFLPAWKRDAYEAAGQDDGFSGQELVKVDEIRVD